MAWRRSLGIADDEVVIGFFSRLVMEKGLDVFSDAIDELRRRGIKYRVLVVGDGPAREWFQNRLPEAVFAGFFANAELFRRRVLDAVAGSPTPVRWLVVGAEPITSVDVTSADALDELDGTLHEAGIELCFAEMKGPVKDKLKRFGLFARLGEQRFFATLGEAVSDYLESQSVAWVDWEDRVDGGAKDSAQKDRTARCIDPPAQAR